MWGGGSKLGVCVVGIPPMENFLPGRLALEISPYLLFASILKQTCFQKFPSSNCVLFQHEYFECSLCAASTVLMKMYFEPSQLKGAVW